MRADVFAEDLGHKTIEGIDALGVKTTQIGSEEDEWKGKPIRIFETWVSDDLAAALVEKVIDLKKNMETTSRLTDVSRVEPDASLFEIPPDIKSIQPLPRCRSRLALGSRSLSSQSSNLGTRLHFSDNRVNRDLGNYFRVANDTLGIFIGTSITEVRGTRTLQKVNDFSSFRLNDWSP